MPQKPNPFVNKGISKAVTELYQSGVTDYTQIWRRLQEKGIKSNRSYVWQLVQKLAGKTKKPLEKKGIETTVPSEKPPQMSIEFKPVKIPEGMPEEGGIPTAEAVPPTVGEAAVEQGLITDEEMQAMIETINAIPTNPRYQIHDKAIPALAKAWTRVLNKRLTDVADPNFDLYWAAAITLMAALPPLMNYIADRRKQEPKTGLSKNKPIETRAKEETALATAGAPDVTMQPTVGYP